MNMYAYSIDGELWENGGFTSRQMAIDEACSEHPDVEWVHTGRVLQLSVAHLCPPSEWVMDAMSDKLYESVGDYGHGWGMLSQEELADLRGRMEDVLTAFLTEVDMLPNTFFEVHDIRQHEVEATEVA